MRVAVVGSRGLNEVDLGKYLPKKTTEIVSGGAIGIDSCARDFAIKNNLKLTEFLPDYKKFGRSAPIKRNIEIIDYADVVFAFWDGKSNGTRFVIDRCKELKVPYRVYVYRSDQA